MQNPIISRHFGARMQRGMITLAISMAILVLSTLVVFGVSDAIQMEQKITNNEARAKQAFEVAEAGMAIAMNYLNEDPDADGDGNIDWMFDTDGDGDTDANEMAIGTGFVRVVVNDLSGDLTSIRVAST